MLLTDTALLGVTRSINGFRWQMRPCDARLGTALSQRHHLADIIGQLLAARGVSLEDATPFLAPSLRHALPDPSLLKDMDSAAERLASAVIAQETIGIFGDYDVDGATSSALLVRFLRAVGAKEPIVHIPDRMKEGYGPSIPAMDSLKARGASCIVTVDCGTVSFEPLAHARALGLDVIVIDHHISEIAQPEAYAIVNPNRFDETPGLGHLAAVGVCYLLAVALNRTLRQHGYYNTRPEPDLLSLLDIVALGTICDVVPLTGLNRAYVSQGLKIMARRQNLGLKTLMDTARMEEAPAAYHAGFILGPRINAGGRVGQSDLGVRLLTTEDPTEAHAIALQLEQYNAERRSIESMVLEQATDQLSKRGSNLPVLFAAGQGWHPGVIGIAAGRLKERFHRPVAVIALDQSVGKASARSITGVDFGTAIHAARAEGLLIAGGGHAMAAGFTVEEAKLDALHQFLCQRMAAQVDAAGADPILKIDAVLSPSAAKVTLLQQLEKLAPYGTGNPEPRFVLQQAHIMQAEPMGNGEHTRLLVNEGAFGGKATKTRIKAVAFRTKDTPFGAALASATGRKAHLAGKLKLNRWQGYESVDFLLDDLAWAE